MKVTFEFKGRKGHHNVIGYLDFTWSVQRIWKGDSRGIPTWRHITVGLHSPACRQPGSLYKDGKPRWTWHRLRFGAGGGNLYLGIVYIITTFGRQHPPLEYTRFGPFEWARQPTINEYLARSRR